MSCIITLPRFVVFTDMEGEAGVPFLFTVSSADDEKKGYVMASDDAENDIKKSDVKFEIVPATTTGGGGGLVHIRSCLTGKYLRVLQTDDSSSESWIVAAADEPEEDQSNQGCTLFEPQGRNSMLDSIQVRLRAVVNNSPVRVAATASATMGAVDFGWVASESDQGPLTLSYKEWETLVFLPPNATFKGSDNKFLKPTDEAELKFSGIDQDDDELSGNTISNDINGFIYIKNNKLGKYWRAPEHGGRIGVDNRHKCHECKFWPEKIGKNVYAIRSFNFQGDFLYRDDDGYLRINGRTPESADVPSEAQFTVEEQSIVVKENTLPRFVLFYLYGAPWQPLLCSSADDDAKNGKIMRSDSPLDSWERILYTDAIIKKPDVKFEVVQAASGGGLVHIRSCLTKKFLRVQSESSRWIVAAGDEPEEDKSKWSCTLFKPEHGYDDSLNLFNSNGIQIDFRKTLNDDEPYGAAAWHLNEPGDGSCNSLLKFTDWETLVFLPRHVVFKGDNGKYLLTDESGELKFSGSDPADEVAGAGHQIFSNGKGSVCVMSDKSGKYWRAPRDGGRIVADGEGWLDDRCSFSPVKMDGGNVVALCIIGQRDSYLCRGTGDGDYLNSNAGTAVSAARFTVEEIKKEKTHRCMSPESKCCCIL